MKKEHIPKEILERVEDELLAGERLLWVGLPGRKHLPDKPDVVQKGVAVALLGLMMLGFVALLVEDSGASDESGLWVITTTVMISVLAVIAVLFQALRSGSHHLYAITNRRAIILSKKTIQSFMPKDLQFIERTMHRDGTGDIVFREDHYRRVIPAGTFIAQRRERVTTGFYGVENPAEVEALMLETFSNELQNHRLMDEQFYDDDALMDESTNLKRRAASRA